MPEESLFKRFYFNIRHNDMLFLSSFKMVISTLLLYPNSVIILIFVRSVQYDQSGFIMTTIMYTYLSLVLMADLVLNITFIVATHRECTKLLKISYLGTTVVAVLFIMFLIMLLTYVVCNIHRNYTYGSYYTILIEILAICVAGLTHVVLQVYVILVLRSGMKKLEKYCEATFTKVTEEACRIHTKQEISTIDEEGNDHIENGVVCLN